MVYHLDLLKQQNKTFISHKQYKEFFMELILLLINGDFLFILSLIFADSSDISNEEIIWKW